MRLSHWRVPCPRCPALLPSASCSRLTALASAPLTSLLPTALRPGCAAQSKHEAAHRPQMGRGCVIKNNANMCAPRPPARRPSRPRPNRWRRAAPARSRRARARAPRPSPTGPRPLPLLRRRYATDSVTSFVVRELGKMAGAPTQEFVVKNDCPCGSTIGPILAERLGVRAADVGMPQLSMHSCRELMGSDDLTHCYKLLCAFFGRFEEVDSRLGVCKRPRVDSASEALQ